ncbi:hypothetical protein [Saccharicrinis sp. FJH54]|uniref:hypothetical protein n=1 Tax=Saccharicrinis sp. FJH54 TaxID=3344665 RepID=UPI0035D497EC
MIYSINHLQTELKSVLTVVTEGNYQNQTLEIIKRMKDVKADAKCYVKGILLIDILLMNSLVLQVTKANHHILWHTQITSPDEAAEFKKVKEECLLAMRRFLRDMDQKFKTKAYIVLEENQYQ